MLVNRSATMQIDLCEAKTRLAELVEAASRGKTIVIAKSGRPLAKLGPTAQLRQPIRLGLMRHQITIADDFDAPLSGDGLVTSMGASPL